MFTEHHYQMTNHGGKQQWVKDFLKVITSQQYCELLLSMSQHSTETDR